MSEIFLTQNETLVTNKSCIKFLTCKCICGSVLVVLSSRVSRNVFKHLIKKIDDDEVCVAFIVDNEKNNKLIYGV